uniref:RRM domain-containing protein n=1 Tax=viral metagenome TaxID=1070528 RepID=A0A6C0BN72_9ZZZZ
MDPCKIAFITEALSGFNPQELQFLYGFIHAKLARLAAVPSATTKTEATPVTKDEPNNTDPSDGPSETGPSNTSSTETAPSAGSSEAPSIGPSAGPSKTVKWADVAATPPSENDTKKVFRKTPHRGVKAEKSAIPVPAFEDKRKKAGNLYTNQLYVRGWNPDLVKWETVRQRLWEELSEMHLDVSQIYVDAKGFAFITLTDQECATRAQKILSEIPSFYGDELLVKFATVRNK